MIVPPANPPTSPTTPNPFTAFAGANPLNPVTPAGPTDIGGTMLATPPRGANPISGQPPVVPPASPGLAPDGPVGGAQGFLPTPGSPTSPGGADYAPWMRDATGQYPGGPFRRIRRTGMNQ